MGYWEKIKGRFQEDPYKELHLFGLGLFAFLMPLLQSALPILSVLLGVNALLFAFCCPERCRKAFSEKKGRGLPLMLIAFFSIYLIGTLYTDDLSAAAFDLQKKAGFVFFPLLFWAMPLPCQKELSRILKFFILGCVIAFLIGGGHAVHVFLTEGDGESTYLLYGEHFAFHIHRGYLAIYFLFGIMILSNGVPGLSSWGWSLGVLLLIGVFLTASRAALLLFPFLLIVYVIRDRRTSFLKRSFVAASVMLLLAGAFFLFPRNRGRFQEMYRSVTGGFERIDQEDPGGAEARLMIWSAGSELFMENWVTGVGTGDEDVKLQEEYERRGWSFLEKKGFNAHCQFLQTGIAVGVLGVMLLLGVFMTGMRKGWASSPLLLYLCSILLVSTLFESILERQAGILFMAFFLPLLAFCAGKGEQEVVSGQGLG